jgi:transposase
MIRTPTVNLFICHVLVMGKRSYSPSKVHNAIRTYFALSSFRKASKATGIPRSTVHDWVRRITIRRVKKKRHKKRYAPRKLAQQASLVTALLQRDPLTTMTSIRAALGGSMSLASVSRLVRWLGFSYRKVSWRTPPRDLSLELQSFHEEFRHLVDSGARVISLDETGFLSNQNQLRGYGRKGSRLRLVKRHVRRFKVSSIVAISAEGIEAMESYQCNINGAVFNEFVEDLFSRVPDSVVLLDNVSFHKSAVVRKLAERHNIRLMYPPPYSPECNPVEHFFSACKSAVRRTISHRHDPFASDDDFYDTITDTLHTLADAHDFAPYFGVRAMETQLPVNLYKEASGQ